MPSPDTFFATSPGVLGQGDPRRILERWAVQPAPDIPAATGFHDTRTFGGTPVLAPTVIERQANLGTPMAQTPIPGPLNIPDSNRDLGDLDLENFAQLALLANLVQYYDHTTDGDANTFTMSQLGGTAAPTDLTNLVSLDTGLIQRFTGVKAKGFTLGGQKGQNLKLGVTTVEAGVDFHGPFTQTAGSSSTLPELRLTKEAATLTADSVDGDFYFKVISLVSTTGAVISAKRGASASYSSTFTVTFGVWTDVLNSDGSPMGTRAEQPQIYWPVGATISANDIFKALKRRSLWTPSFPISRYIGITQVRIYFNGQRLNLDGGFNFAASVAGVTRRMATEKNAVGTERSGEQMVNVTLTRQMVGLVMQLALLQQDVNTLVIEAIGDALIGASTVPYGLELIMPALRASGNSYAGKSGLADRSEALTLRASQADTAYAWKGNSYTADLTLRATTGITALG